MKLKGLALFFLVCFEMGYSQVETFKASNQTFVKPSLISLGSLMSNVDSVYWNKALIKEGFVWLPVNQRTYLLEYKKTASGYSQYVGFDHGYGVLTIIWTDDNGKISLCKSLKKALRKKDYQVPGTYRTTVNNLDLIIMLESRKEKSIHEMITVEIARK